MGLPNWTLPDLPSRPRRFTCPISTKSSRNGFSTLGLGQRSRRKLISTAGSLTQLICSGSRHPILDPAYHQLLQSLGETPVVDISPLLLTYITADDGQTRPREWASKSFRKLKGADQPRLEAWIEVWSALIQSLARSQSNYDEDLIDLVLGEWTPDQSLDTKRKVGRAHLACSLQSDVNSAGPNTSNTSIRVCRQTPRSCSCPGFTFRLAVVAGL